MTATITYDYILNDPGPEIFEDAGDFPGSPDAVALANDNFMVADSVGSGEAILVHLYNAKGAELATSLINPGTAGATLSAVSPSITALANGRAVVTYTDASGAKPVVRAQIIDQNGKLQGNPIPVGPNGANDSHSQVTALKDGGFVVTYDHLFANSLTDFDIHATVYNADGSVRTADVNVAGTNAVDQQAHVAALSGGGFVETWVRTDASGFTSTYFRLFDANGTAKGAEKLGDSAGAVNDGLTVTALKDGGFAMAYFDDGWNTGSTEITVKLFNADGSARTDFIQVNAPFTTGNQSQPAMTVLANGFLMVSWTEVGSQSTKFTVLDTQGKIVLEPRSIFSEGDHVTEATLATLADGIVAAIGTGHGDDGSTVIEGQLGRVVRSTIGDGSSETLSGDDLTDFISGNGGNDTLKGLGGNDNLSGGAGKDTLDGGAGADRMDGGADNDSYFVEDANDTVIEAKGGGTDTVLASRSYALGAFAEVEVLKTNNAAAATIINLTGNNGVNTLVGNNGANTLDGKFGVDIMQGLGGNDIYVVDVAGDKVIEAANGGTDTVRSFATAFTLSGEVENLELQGIANINAIGNGLANKLTGNIGSNVLNGGLDADTMTGLAGNDTYVVDNAGDKVAEAAGGGTDTVQSFVSFTLGSEVEKLTLVGTANIAGTGNGLANTLIGNGGANTLNGGLGADTMTGGAGNDIYVVDNSNEKVLEAKDGGIDTVQSFVSFTLGTEVERLTLVGTGNISGTGNGLANVMIGNGGANTLDGKGAADIMSGGAGNDTYFVESAGDKVVEAANSANGGTDKVFSAVSFTLGSDVENLTFTGSNLANGTGNGLANGLSGNTAANVLNGLLGSDSLFGGAGADTFVFSSALNATTNVDRIVDFFAPDDTIRLDDAVFAGLKVGALAAGAFFAGAAAHDADDRIVYNQASGDLFFDKDGSGAGAAVKFAHLDNHAAMSAADFFVI